MQTLRVMQVMQVMQAMQVIKVMQVMQVMQVKQVMQVEQIEQVEQVMQVIQENLYRDHFWWRHMVAKFPTYTISTIWWIVLQLMQVTQPGGPICN